MPELPDITIYIEALEKRILHACLQRVQVASPFLLRTAAPPISALEGKEVVELRRLGKRICFGFEDGLWMVLHFSKVLSSIIGGDISDRVGRKTMILAGWLIYALVYAGFGFATSAWQAWVLFIIYGFYFGLTEGVEKALVADLVTDEKRGTAFGFYSLAYGITVFPASLIFGLVWTTFGAAPAFLMSAVISILASAFLMTVRSRPVESS